jgi:hypothetical protein
MKPSLVLVLLSSCGPLPWVDIAEDGVEIAEEIYKNYPSDNPLEEWTEEQIKEKLGLEVDLSPFSPEKK